MAAGHQHRHDHHNFLDVFLMQNSQNRDSAAIQVKLDELIRVSAAHNSFVGIEHLTDEELQVILTKCEKRAAAEKTADETVQATGKNARMAARFGMSNRFENAEVLDRQTITENIEPVLKLDRRALVNIIPVSIILEMKPGEWMP